MRKARLMVVDGHLAFGEALATRLRFEEDLDVIAAVQSAAQARRALAGREVDIILIDDDLPDEQGIALTAELHPLHPGTRIVILGEGENAQHIADAVRAGASGWVTKDSSMDHLLALLRGVARGETWISPGVLTGVLGALVHDEEVSHEGEAVLARLTQREREVLLCMAEGLDRGQIAARLHLSPNTVRTHTQKVLSKLGVHTSLAAVAVARRAGITGVGPDLPASGR
ncbi:MAG TPA: response regulator transcription factor [Actinomycetes bacterium]